MTDLNVRLRFDAEVAAARAGIKAVEADMAKLTTATRDTTAAGKVLGAAILLPPPAAASVIVPSLVQIKAALDQQSQSATALASAQAALGISTREVSVDIARLAGLSNTITPAMQEETNALIRLNQEFDMMRMLVDQGYAASVRFAQGQDLARDAVASGIATEQQAAATLDLLAEKLGLVEGKAGTTGVALQRHTMSSGAAAASSANLAANFNDVAVMAIAGQDPLMTAIQQGTQISQVFGQAGAGGALGMLKQGFMAFLSPTTLVTIALIAGGSALLQWATGAGSAETKAKSLEDAVADLQSRISDFKSKSSVSLDDLKTKFGEVTPEVIRLNDEMTSLAGVQAIIAATEAMRSLRSEATATWMEWATTNVGLDASKVKIAELLDVPLNVPGPEDEPRGRFSLQNTLPNPAIQEYQDAVLDAATTHGFDNQVEALQRVQAAIVAAAGGIDNMTMEQTKQLAAVHATEMALIQMRAAQDAATGATGLSAAAQQVMLDKLLQEAAIQQAIAKYGADSAQVAALRLEGERKVHQAMVASLSASDDMKASLNDAWEAAHKIESADIAKRLADGAQNAENLKLFLQGAWDNAVGLETAGPGGDWLSGAMGQADTLAGKLWQAWYAASSLGSGGPLPELRGPAGMGESPPTGGAVMTSIRPGQREVDSPTFGPTTTTSGGGGGGSSGPEKGSLADITAQSKAAMDTLDLSIAAINEKVQAGLMSTAEAADAVTSAKGQAADTLADLVAQLGKLGPAGQAAAVLIRSNMVGLASDLKSVGADLAQTLSEGFKSPFKDFLTGAKSAEQAMGALGDFIIDKLADIAAQKATSGFIDPLLNMLFAGFGSEVGGAGAVASSPVPPPRPFGKGGVPDGAPLPALRNRVLNRPTLFPMAKGMGLMAEAGTEAIMPVGDGGVLAMIGGRETRLPLMRGPGGRLGVDVPEWAGSMIERAPMAFAKGGLIGTGAAMAVGDYGGGGGAAGASPKVTVNVTTPAGHTAQVNDRMDGRGHMVVDVLVEQVEGIMAGNLRAGRGAHAAAMADTFGLRRSPR